MNSICYRYSFCNLCRSFTFSISHPLGTHSLFQQCIPCPQCMSLEHSGRNIRGATHAIEPGASHTNPSGHSHPGTLQEHLSDMVTSSEFKKKHLNYDSFVAIRIIFFDSRN